MAKEKTKTIFVEALGDSPKVRVLDFFLTFGDFDYSKSQVAKEIGISRITIEPIWGELEKKGIIIKTRRIGRAEMYKLNKKNPLVKELLEFDMKLCSAYADEEVGSVEAVVAV